MTNNIILLSIITLFSNPMLQRLLKRVYSLPYSVFVVDLRED